LNDEYRWEGIIQAAATAPNPYSKYFSYREVAPLKRINGDWNATLFKLTSPIKKNKKVTIICDTLTFVSTRDYPAP
jgi:hypothetical protein